VLRHHQRPVEHGRIRGLPVPRRTRRAELGFALKAIWAHLKAIEGEDQIGNLMAPSKRDDEGHRHPDKQARYQLVRKHWECPKHRPGEPFSKYRDGFGRGGAWLKLILPPSSAPSVPGRFSLRSSEAMRRALE